MHSSRPHDQRNQSGAIFPLARLEAEFAAAADALVAAAPARPFPAMGLLARVRRTVHPRLVRGCARIERGAVSERINKL